MKATRLSPGMLEPLLRVVRVAFATISVKPDVFVANQQSLTHLFDNLLCVNDCGAAHQITHAQMAAHTHTTCIYLYDLDLLIVILLMNM